MDKNCTFEVETKKKRWSVASPFLVILLGTMSCSCPGKDKSQTTSLEDTRPAVRQSRSSFSYALDNPDEKYVLPRNLLEVSGITNISDTEIGCVQDEHGTIFIYDLKQRAITKQIHFGDPGDYEGLTVVGQKLFVLRSDGLLYEISKPWEKPSIATRQLDIVTKNNEGLGFDPESQRILISPKSRLGKGKAFKDARAIFAFDLKKMELMTEPVLQISVNAILEFAQDHGLPIPTKQKKKGGGKRLALRLMPSSVAVHPMTKDVVVLSAVDHVLASFDNAGRVTGYAALDAKIFTQPEGITFLSNGDMVIASEGMAGTNIKPTLLFFRWHPADENSTKRQ